MNKEKKLTDLIESQYKSIRDFSIKNDIPYSTVRSVLQRGIDNSGVNTVTKIVNALGVNMDYFEETEYVREDLVEYSPKNVHILPILGSVRAGEPMLAADNIEGYFSMDNDVLCKDKEYFFLRVRGDSMDREFKEGSLLLIERTKDVISGDIAVVLVNGDEATVKKITINDNILTLIPMSNNAKYLPIPIDMSKHRVNIIGKVKMAIRSY